MAAKLGQILLNNNIISEDQLIKAIEQQKKEGGRIGSNLIKLGSITEDALVEFLSKQYGVPAVTLTNRQQPDYCWIANLFYQ